MRIPLSDLLILALAVWRVSSLLVREDGPWALLARLRYHAGVRYDESSLPYGDGVLGDLFICTWCMSVWIGLVTAVLYLVWPAPTLMAALPLALSAAAIIVDERTGD